MIPCIDRVANYRTTTARGLAVTGVLSTSKRWTHLIRLVLFDPLVTSSTLLERCCDVLGDWVGLSGGALRKEA